MLKSIRYLNKLNENQKLKSETLYESQRKTLYKLKLNNNRKDIYSFIRTNSIIDFTLIFCLVYLNTIVTNNFQLVMGIILIFMYFIFKGFLIKEKLVPENYINHLTDTHNIVLNDVKKEKLLLSYLFYKFNNRTFICTKIKRNIHIKKLIKRFNSGELNLTHIEDNTIQKRIILESDEYKELKLTLKKLEQTYIDSWEKIIGYIAITKTKNSSDKIYLLQYVMNLNSVLESNTDTAKLLDFLSVKNKFILLDELLNSLISELNKNNITSKELIFLDVFNDDVYKGLETIYNIINNSDSIKLNELLLSNT